jgi:uncharacterized membrane protein YeaQ/YmgE (transglycosylase-associated protein family)
VFCRVGFFFAVEETKMTVLADIVASWLATKVLDVSGYGLFGDLLVCSIGGLVGGVVIGLFVAGDPGFWGSLVGALIGACILVGGARLVLGNRSA